MIAHTGAVRCSRGSSVTGTPDIIQLHLSGDSAAGQPTFTFAIDGVAMNGNNSVLAVHNTHEDVFTYARDLTSGSHSFTITANDAGGAHHVWVESSGVVVNGTPSGGPVSDYQITTSAPYSSSFTV